LQPLMTLRIRVLGEVQILIDGEPQLRRAQEQKALAVLVAARGPQRPEAFFGPLWEAGHPTARDALLAPVIARLRRILRAHGLDITSARQSRGYQLVGEDLTGCVDAYRFERAALSVLDDLTAGRYAEAELGFEAAAREWTGEPFAAFGAPFVQAEPMRSFVTSHSRVREKALEALARAALTRGRYERAAAWSALSTAQPGALWLLRVLETLRREGIAAAEELVEAGARLRPRPALGQRDELGTRAFDLLSLHEAGIDVHTPLLGSASGGTGLPLGDLLERVGAGAGAALAVRHDGAPATRTLCDDVSARSAARGIGTITVRCRSLEELAPWREIVGRLAAHLLRDLGAEPIAAAPRRHIAQVVAAPDGHDPARLTDLLETLLRAVLRTTALILTFDDAQFLGPAAASVRDKLAARLPQLPLGLVLIGAAGPERTPWFQPPGIDLTGEAAELRAKTMVRLARQWSDPGLIDEPMIHQLRTALAALTGPETEPVRLQLQAHLAHKSTMAVPAHARDGDGPELARRTLDALTPAHSPAVRCEVLNECRWGLYDDAPPAELRDVSVRLREAAIAAREPYFESEALVALVVDSVRLADFPAAYAALKDHRRLVTEHPRPQGEWLQGVMDTMLHLWRGSYDRAAAWLFGPGRHAVEEFKPSPLAPADNLRQTWQGQCYWLLRELGRTEELFAQDLALDIEQDAHFPIWPASLILACCDTGRLDDAADRLAAFTRVYGILSAWPPHGWSLPTAAVLAEAVTAIPREPVAAALVDPLRELLSAHREEIVLAGWPTVLMGPAARYSGILALLADDVTAAIDDLTLAATLAHDSPPVLARVRHDLARALRRHGDTTEAATLQARAHASATRLGLRLPPWHPS
jgi:DNA-binding SARP family transcriptional activator